MSVKLVRLSFWGREEGRALYYTTLDPHDDIFRECCLVLPLSHADAGMRPCLVCLRFLLDVPFGQVILILFLCGPVSKSTA